MKLVEIKRGITNSKDLVIDHPHGAKGILAVYANIKEFLPKSKMLK